MMTALNALALVVGWLVLLTWGGALALLALHWARRPAPAPQPTFQPARPPYSRERPRLASEKFQAHMRWAVSPRNPAPKEPTP